MLRWSGWCTLRERSISPCSQPKQQLVVFVVGQGTSRARGADRLSCGLPGQLVFSALVTLQERNIQTSAEWRQQMSQVDVSILQHMRDNIKGGFDEERHGPRVGFGNLKR